MRALCWMGINELSVETVDDPTIVNPHDAIVEVGLTTTCGSDLHFLAGYLPGMRAGDVIGHEFMGRVVEVGSEVRATAVGTRVVVPSFIGCDKCWYCEHDLYSLCDTTNPNAYLQRPILTYPTGGIYGYTHPFGGYQGSHAQYIRVPFADTNCFSVPDGITDTAALFVSDALPTGYMGADFCGLSGGETVAVWGAGGVGLMAAASARVLGAERVIVIDQIPERLALARDHVGAEIVDFSATDSVVDTLREMTGGRGPDAVIEAVGMEGDTHGVAHLYDKAKQALRLESDRATALREAILACRKGGTVSMLGVYGITDKFPTGALMNKGLTLRTAQQHGQAYVPRLLDLVESGSIDPTILRTHEMPLEDAAQGYDKFKTKQDNCIRAVFRP